MADSNTSSGDTNAANDAATQASANPPETQAAAPATPGRVRRTWNAMGRNAHLLVCVTTLLLLIIAIVGGTVVAGMVLGHYEAQGETQSEMAEGIKQIAAAVTKTADGETAETTTGTADTDSSGTPAEDKPVVKKPAPSGTTDGTPETATGTTDDDGGETADPHCAVVNGKAKIASDFAEAFNEQGQAIQEAKDAVARAQAQHGKMKPIAVYLQLDAEIEAETHRAQQAALDGVGADGDVK